MQIIELSDGTYRIRRGWIYVSRYLDCSEDYFWSSDGYEWCIFKTLEEAEHRLASYLKSKQKPKVIAVRTKYNLETESIKDPKPSFFKLMLQSLFKK